MIRKQFSPLCRLFVLALLLFPPPALAQMAISSGQLIRIEPPAAPEKTQGRPRPEIVIRERGSEAGTPVTLSIGGGLKVDVYQPEGRPKGMFAFMRVDDKAPVLLYVHGGGWVKGDRGKVYGLPAYARSRGYVLVSTDYRPLPKTSIDGQISDVARAIAWTRANIGRFGGDPGRIVIMGHSSGSHLVSMVGVKKLGGALRGIVANDVQAYDLPSYYALRKNSMDRVYVRAFGNNRANWVKYSPITWARKGAGYPPFLIMYSQSNYERRRQLASAFGAELKKRGTRVTLFDGSGYTHGTIASRIGSSQKVTAALDRFLTGVYR